MSKQVLTVPVNSIDRPVQVRNRSSFTGTQLAGLAESIKESGGIHQPLLVRRVADRLSLVDGERRLAAAILAGCPTVPVIVIDDITTDAEVMHRQLVLDAQRVSLEPLDRARALTRLIEATGWSIDTTARRLGLSPATISRTVAMLRLPDAILAQVAEGNISADAAYRLSQVDSPSQQSALAVQLCEGRLTRDGLARKLKASRRSGERRVAGLTKSVAILGNGRSITLAGPGLTLETMMEWLDALLVRARKAKAQGITLETFVRALRDQAKEGKGVPS